MPYVTKYKTTTAEAVLGYETIPIHRPKIIYFEFNGLRPNIPHWIFFDGKDVTNYCNTSYTLDNMKSAGKNSWIKEAGDNFIKDTGFPASKGGPTGTPLYTNAVGKLSGFFYLQSNSSLSFKTTTDGIQFIAIDISKIDKDGSLSYAASKFYAFGEYESYYQYAVTTSYKVWVDPPRPANNGGGGDDGGSYSGGSAAEGDAARYGGSGGYGGGAGNGGASSSSGGSGPGNSGDYGGGAANGGNGPR